MALRRLCGGRRYKFVQRAVVIILTVALIKHALSSGDAPPDLNLASVLEPAQRDPAPVLQKLEAGVYSSFDWNDWLPLDDAIDFYSRRELDPTLYPNLSEDIVDAEYFPFQYHTTQHEVSLAGKLYVYNYMPFPMRIIALPDPQKMHDTEANSAAKLPTHWLVTHSNTSRLHRQFGSHDPATELDMHLKVPPVSGQIRDLALSINQEAFIWDPDQIIENDRTSSQSQELAKSIILASTAEPHFRQVHIRNDKYHYGGHYDWRFFQGILDADSHAAALHSLARAWQTFAESMAVQYWYAHGPLIGWYYTGFTLPWDLDLDIQVPIQELDRLARVYNRTLVVQNPKEGNGKYLIDISPWYVQRSRGNWQNLIDGRFIDIDTGIYIDITGLAFGEVSDDRVKCKAAHHYKLDDILPLQRTSFEGLPAYIPNQVEAALDSEYPKWRQARYSIWRWNDKIGLWQIGYSCDEIPNRIKYNNLFHCFPKQDMAGSSDCDVETFGTCDRFALAEYHNVRHILADHRKEVELKSLQPLPAAEMKALVNKYNPPFHTKPRANGRVMGLDLELSDLDSTDPEDEDMLKDLMQSRAGVPNNSSRPTDEQGVISH